MRVFAKWFFGFDPVRWPWITFTRGGCTNLLNESSPGDVVVFVGSKGEATRQDGRGRVLGAAQFGWKKRNSLEVLNRESLGPYHFNERGEFRWPNALPILKAWGFPEKPNIIDLLGHQLPPHAQTYAVVLDEADTEKILTLEWQELAALPDPQLEEQHAALAGFDLGRHARGPAPTNVTGTFARNADQPASTYVFRFGKENIWKIGWAIDAQARLVEVNKHIPIEAPGQQRWEIVQNKPCASTKEAYQIEQRALGSLTQFPIIGERVQCPEGELQRAWGQSTT